MYEVFDLHSINVSSPKPPPKILQCSYEFERLFIMQRNVLFSILILRIRLNLWKFNSLTFLCFLMKRITKQNHERENSTFCSRSEIENNKISPRVKLMLKDFHIKPR